MNDINNINEPMLITNIHRNNNILLIKPQLSCVLNFWSSRFTVPSVTIVKEILVEPSIWRLMMGE